MPLRLVHGCFTSRRIRIALSCIGYNDERSDNDMYKRDNFQGSRSPVPLTDLARGVRVLVMQEEFRACGTEREVTLVGGLKMYSTTGSSK